MNHLKQISLKLIGYSLLAVILLFAAVPELSLARSVQELQRQIDQLDSQIEQNQSRASTLRREGDTLQARLNQLEEEARAIRQEITVTEAEIATTQSEIAAIEAELARTKHLIQENVKVLYKQGKPTTLEMLFSSDNFTDFINRQEYLDRVKTSLNEAARQSVVLKQELEGQEEELQLQSRALDNQRRQLVVRQREQQHLLEVTRGEERRYQALAQEQEQQQQRLREEQAAAMAAAAAARRGSGPDFTGSTEYPWPTAAMNYNDFCVYPDGTVGADPWGYCLRQCTSYVAWMLAKDGRSGFSYLGHASAWKFHGQPIAFQNARRGDVLIWDIGGYGHVMYIEARTAQGLSISQFNTPFGSGTYSTDFFSFNELNSGVGGAGFAVRRF